MIITTGKIERVLQNNKNLFDPEFNEDQFNDAKKKIIDGIMEPPVIQESKWVHMTKIRSTESGKTVIYQVRTKTEPSILLGEIRWCINFKCYSFYPEQNTIFHTPCLNDINYFIEALMLLHNGKAVADRG